MSEETLTTGAETAPRKRKKKSRNPFVRYFVPFGLKQITDLLMLAGAIVILIGLIFHGLWLENTVVIVGMFIYVVASLIAIFRCVRVFISKTKTNSEHKSALINVIIMGIILALSVLGILAAFLLW